MFSTLIQKTKSVFKPVKNRLAKPLHIVATTFSNHEIEEINRYLDDQDRRHYTKKQRDVYSVTTILDQLEEDKEGLKWWKKHNDGEGDNADWRHLLQYKKDRGTLAHHAAMADHYQQLNGEELWSSDETQSLYNIMDAAENQDFLYSIMNDKDWVNTQKQFHEIVQSNEKIQLDEILGEDLDYFTSEYDKIAEQQGINADTLEAVEEMFVVPPNGEHNGYGGQADLVYRDPMTGEAVVADLKTSSAVREKHKYQAAAYAKAVEKTDNLPIENVARAEIIRIHPDSKESEVYTVNDIDSYWEEFAETTYEL